MTVLTMRDEEAAEVRGILSRLLPPGVRVHAFGSRAGGKPKPWSDLDLVFEGDGPLPLSLLGRLRDAFEISNLPWKVDLVDRATVSEAFGRIIDDSKIALDEDVGRELILHEDPVSGNCYKIRLTAALLGVALQRKCYDITKGETRTPQFLREINANGRIPVLQIGERMLPESNAACWYLAEGSALIPAERFARADMLRWMFFEQYNHEPNVATLRFWLHYLGEERLTEAQRAQIPGKQAAGETALRLMDEHLASRPFFVGEGATLADIALYPYTHVAEQGGAFRLADYPHVQRWLDRIAQLRGYVPMVD